MVVRDRCNRRRVRAACRHIEQAGSLLLAVSLLLAADPASGQERGVLPVTVDGERVKLATITYKPAGTGPFPVLIDLALHAARCERPTYVLNRLSDLRTPVTSR